MGLAEELLEIKQARERLIRQRDMAQARYDSAWEQLRAVGINSPEELQQELDRLSEQIRVDEELLNEAIRNSKELLGLS